MTDIADIKECATHGHYVGAICPRCDETTTKTRKKAGTRVIGTQSASTVPVRMKNRGKSKWRYRGLYFDSKDEAYRYGYLKDLQADGVIRHLFVQPTMVIRPAFELNQPYHVRRKDGTPRVLPAEKYTPDYAYIYDGMLIIEDVKGIKKGKPYSKANSDRSQKHLQYRYRNNPRVMFMLVTMGRSMWRYWQASTGYPELAFSLSRSMEDAA